MTSYAGLDVSQQETQICVLEATGAVRWTGKARSEPMALAAVLRRRAPDLARAVLDSGTLSGWLCGGLVAAGLPEIRGHHTNQLLCRLFFPRHACPVAVAGGGSPPARPTGRHHPAGLGRSRSRTTDAGRDISVR